MDSKTERIMTPVIQALSSRQDAEAVRLFQEAVANSPSLRDSDLSTWLVKTIGKAPAQRLIQAYAEYPCMGCKQGLLKCAPCHGKGEVSDDEVCERCMGFRAMNCDFCAGAGWITYNFVPPGLVAAVVLERSRRVLARAKSLLAAPSAAESDESASEKCKALTLEVLQLNRILGVMDNALAVAHAPSPLARKHKQVLMQVQSACIAGAARVEKRLRKTLHELAECWESRSGSGANRGAAAKRARYYERLASAKDFSRTGLFHVYLTKARHKQAAATSGK